MKTDKKADNGKHCPETVIGAITIGQSPRTDITGDICPLLASNIKLKEYGALDDFDLAYIQSHFAPKSDSAVLVTRMRDGSQAIIGEEYICSLVQDCITKAEADGCTAVILLCTGKFPKFKHSRMLLIPQPLIHAVVQKLADEKPVGLLVPDKSQISQAKDWFSQSDICIKTAAVSPYLEKEQLRQKAMELQKEDLALILPDCMGYSISMKEELEEILSVPVLLPRTFMAHLLNELFG